MIETASTLTPWHPHHIAERYGLLPIITLGEIVLGTTTAVQAVVEKQGWSTDALLVVFSGASIAFGLWWIYFAIPFGSVLEARRDRGWPFGLGHLPLFAATATIGAALHVAASFVDGESTLDEGQTVLVLALAMAAFMAIFYLIVGRLLPGTHRLHVVLPAAMAVVAAVVMARARVPLGWCVVTMALAPWVSVVGHEAFGHRHLHRSLDAVLRRES